MPTRPSPEELRASVDVVAKPWADSPYYANAEKWIDVFWGPNTQFRRLFGRLNLSATTELACGHGRHAEQCVEKCGTLTLVDIFDDNLEASRKRLAGHANVAFLKNNGFDLQPLPDASQTAVYCYDAMVHFSPDLVQSYLLDIARVLAPGGMALLHHSNYAAPPDRHYGQNPNARNHMTFELFSGYARDAKLSIVESVEITWGGNPKLDRLTLLSRSS